MADTSALDRTVETALKAYDDGYRIIAGWFKEAFDTWKIDTRIKADPPPPGVTLDDCRRRLSNALLGIRPLCPDLPSDDQLIPWIVGYLRAERDRPGETVGGIGLHETPLSSWDSATKIYHAVGIKSHWWKDAGQWRAYIVEPMEDNARSWREWLERFHSRGAGASQQEPFADFVAAATGNSVGEGQTRPVEIPAQSPKGEIILDHLQSLYRVRDELDAWGDFEQSESWIEHFPESIEGDKNPSIQPHPLWRAVVELQRFYPKNRLPKLTGALDAWGNLLKYSRRHGNEDLIAQRDLAVENAEILRNWVIEEIQRLESSPSHKPGTEYDDGRNDDQATVRLLSVYTNGLADERLSRAASLLEDEKLTVNEKLTKIDELIPFPATASAAALGKLVGGVSKQAVMKTDWWITNRKGEKENEIGRRRAKHHERAKQHEPNRTNDEDD